MVEDSGGNENVLDVSVDTGGTFTDVVLRSVSGVVSSSKILSSGAVRFVIASVDGSEVELGGELCCPMDWTGFRLQASEHVDIAVVSSSQAGRVLHLAEAPDIRQGTVVDLVNGEPAPVLGVRMATGTAMGAPMPDVALRLGTTRGTNALLEHRTDPVLFVVTSGFADLLLIGTQQRPDIFSFPVVLPDPVHERVLEVDERIDVDGRVLSALDESALAAGARRYLAAGVTSAAVAFLHSWRSNLHEERAAQILRECGFANVTTSSELGSVIRIVPRAQAAVVDAALHEPVGTFLASVRSGMEAQRTNSQPRDVLVMTSGGGLVSTGAYRARDSLLSGPAAGVAGAAGVGRQWGFDRILSFDMGGTSTDVSRWDRGFTYRFEQEIGDVRLSAEALDIHTVASGGGSMCHMHDGQLEVGPLSGGAEPGPACYGRGGPLCLTDINLLSGRLDAGQFGIPIDKHAARSAFDALLDQVDAMEDQVLDRFLARANRRMADAVGQISLRQGCDPLDFVLVAFGGAGPQHACAVADSLGIQSVLVPSNASVLSAIGLMQSAIERFEHQQVLEELDEVHERLPAMIEALGAKAVRRVLDAGGSEDSIEVQRVLLDLRLVGQNSSLDVQWTQDIDLKDAFASRFEAMYGYTPPARPIEVDSIHVLAASDTVSIDSIARPEARAWAGGSSTMRARFAGQWVDVPSMARADLSSGDLIAGPALVTDQMTTTVIEQGWSALVGPDGTLLLERSGTSSMVAKHDSAGEVERFADGFTAIAREMGEVLQRCAISVNVKERRDYSCTILDPEGCLVVNAPHMPVHLGSMGVCVQETVQVIDVQPGDVILTNHPKFGGSHLPDLTVITPVHESGGALLGYVASRAHHAEIGGSRPGSMPPRATKLSDESVVIPPMKIIAAGSSRIDEVKSLLLAPPWPTRQIEDNLADIRAAIAANHRGVEALLALADEVGGDVVRSNMQQLQAWAESSARAAILDLPDGHHEAEEFMDDGARLAVAITITGDEACIDFSGSSDVHPGNLNATRAIVRSTVIYVLRLLIGRDIPLNDGIMNPVELIIPRGMLDPPWDDDPARCPAVVGGNVETSQRLVDTLLKALGITAASQGTMNNTIFGNEDFGYYETLGGGCGAMKGTPGASGVHSHMSNTRITDPELLEQRYPVRLESFSLRTNSGGAGMYFGGDGLQRRLRFLEPVQLSILSQRRVAGPYGAAGGQSGAPGSQQVTRVDGSVEELDASDQCDLEAGDALEIWTPGGGGWGPTASP